MRPTKKIAITGGAGQIAYNLLFRIANGDMFGKDQPVELAIAELPEAFQALQGVKMELDDCAFPLLTKVTIGTDPFKVFEGADIALLVGAKPRGPGMERGDLLNENAKIFVEQGKALNQSANKNVKVLVVGNPCNTNALIAMENASNISRNNFHAMTRLDQNRATFQLAQKAGVPVSDITRVAIWGNHSSTQVPDYQHAKIKGKAASDVIQDLNWLQNGFVTTVQKRGAEIIAARGKSSAASAASAIIDTIRSLYTPTPDGEWFSLGVWSEKNPYEIDDHLIFSFPLRSKGDGSWEYVKGLELDGWLLKKLADTQRELIEERDQVREFARLI